MQKMKMKGNERKGRRWCRWGCWNGEAVEEDGPRRRGMWKRPPSLWSPRWAHGLFTSPGRRKPAHSPPAIAVYISANDFRAFFLYIFQILIFVLTCCSDIFHKDKVSFFVNDNCLACVRVTDLNICCNFRILCLRVWLRDNKIVYGLWAWQINSIIFKRLQFYFLDWDESMPWVKNRPKGSYKWVGLQIFFTFLMIFFSTS